MKNIVLYRKFDNRCIELNEDNGYTEEIYHNALINIFITPKSWNNKKQPKLYKIVISFVGNKKEYTIMDIPGDDPGYLLSRFEEHLYGMMKDFLKFYKNMENPQFYYAAEGYKNINET